MEPPVNVLDVVPHLVTDEKRDPRFAARTEARHQPVGLVRADEHGAVAAAVDGALAGIETKAIGRAEPRHEAQVDVGNLVRAQPDDALPSLNGIVERPGGDRPQAQAARRTAALLGVKCRTMHGPAAVLR
jgi:hypothetical protein